MSNYGVQRAEVEPTRVRAEQRAEILAAPGFGKYFTDHMVRIDWTADGGWGDGRRYCPTAR